MRIYDAETLEPVQKLQFTYPHVSIYVPSSGDPRETAIEEGMILSDVFLNEDASLLFTVGRSAEAYPCLFVFRTDSWEECWHIGLDWGLPTDRLFDFAADWPGYIALDADLMHESGKILCVYTYSENPDRNFDSIRQNARTD